MISIIPHNSECKGDTTLHYNNQTTSFDDKQNLDKLFEVINRLNPSNVVILSNLGQQHHRIKQLYDGNARVDFIYINHRINNQIREMPGLDYGNRIINLFSLKNANL
jgi:site-specific DNA-adenine methylase